jgi:hypothetical protein
MNTSDSLYKAAITEINEHLNQAGERIVSFRLCRSVGKAIASARF